jgi:outer membrane protein TolC
MKRTIIILILFVVYGSAALDLKECIRTAEANYPLTRSYAENEEIYRLNSRNLWARYYPDPGFYATGQYQSDVTAVQLPAEVPVLGGKSLVDIPKDQYKLVLGIDQLIWDGGVTSKQYRTEEQQMLIRNQSVRTDIYNIRDRVTDSYFLILVLRQREMSVATAIESMESTLKVVRSRVKNGVLLKSYQDVLEAEKLTLEQSLEDVRSLKKTALRVLSIYLGRVVPEDEPLELPPLAEMPNPENPRSRPEFRLFELNRQNLDLMSDVVSTKLIPKFSAFAQLGYGKPGLNMFDPDFAPYYIVGARISWDVWDWSNSSREQEALAVQKKIVVNQEETLDMNLRMAAEAYINNMDKIRTQLVKEAEILTLRTEIVRQYQSQLNNGVITPSEYTAQFNQELASKINIEQKKIELLREKAKLMILYGIEF